MRSLAFLLLIISFSLTTIAQDQRASFDKKSDSVTPDTPKPRDEKEEFRRAANQIDPAKRVADLQNFVENFPESEQKDRALGLIVSGRAELADKMLANGEATEGIKLFKLAVSEAPVPISNQLFTGVVLQIPNNLFWRGQQKAALEVAKIVEGKISTDANQMLALAAFYLGVENAWSAIDLAKKAIEIDPQSKGGYQTLGLAYRFNFDIEKSAEAYGKAVENNPESTVAKLSFAELQRATGKVSEAISVYQAILASDPANLKAQTGLILSLFDAGKVVDAELEMEKSLAVTPNNLFLLVGAAYWYAAKGDGEKAVELSQKALALEPRYAWGYIAQARGLMKTGDPVAAERTLLAARKFGNFPTLEYEIASARLAAGFYKDAVDELKANFTLKDGVLTTKLGRRVAVDADSFTKLLAWERQASIFQPLSADDPVQAEKLKRLLKFQQKLESQDALNENELAASADEFIKGDDSMKTHRQIYVANQLLEKKKALPKVLEITKEAVTGVDAALTVSSASSAVLADELYEPRRIALLRGESLIVPTLATPILSGIIRGRIEEISGWALFEQEKNDEALVRMKRAATVLPKDSVWMRSTMWKTGVVLEKQEKPDEALNYYIKGYSAEENSAEKKVVIETLYRKINGSLDGLKERLETKPKETNTAAIFVKKDVIIPDVEKEQPQQQQPQEKPREETKSVDDNKVNRDKIPDIVPIAKDSELIPVGKESQAAKAAKISEDLKLNVPEGNAVQTTPPPSEINSSENETKIPPVENKPEVNTSSSETTSEELKTTVPGTKVSNPISNEDLTRMILEDEKKINREKAEESEKSATNISNQLKTEEIKKEPETKPLESTANPVRKPLVIIRDNLLDTVTKIENAEKPLDVSLKNTTASVKKTADKKIEDSNKEKTNDSEIRENSSETELPLITKIPDEPLIKDEKAEKPKDNELKPAAVEKTDIEKPKAGEEITAEITSKPSDNEIEKTIQPEDKLIEKVENKTATTDGETKTPELKLSEDIQNKTAGEETVKEKETSPIDLGATRPRYVPEDKIRDIDEKSSETSERSDSKQPTCQIVLSQDIVSVINNGGSMGVLVGVEKAVEGGEINAVSSSPENVQAVFEPGIGAIPGRAFFIIRSISPTLGEYKVKFETPCGEKEILVKVR
jgi:tetratricopeptide (TPR) repeat protein